MVSRQPKDVKKIFHRTGARCALGGAFINNGDNNRIVNMQSDVQAP
jgi:hypothetical protein